MKKQCENTRYLPRVEMRPEKTDPAIERGFAFVDLAAALTQVAVIVIFGASKSVSLIRIEDTIIQIDTHAINPQFGLWCTHDAEPIKKINNGLIVDSLTASRFANLAVNKVEFMAGYAGVATAHDCGINEAFQASREILF